MLKIILICALLSENNFTINKRSSSNVCKNIYVQMHICTYIFTYICNKMIIEENGMNLKGSVKHMRCWSDKNGLNPVLCMKVSKSKNE